MLLFLKFLLLLTLGYITYQDFKEQKVYTVLLIAAIVFIGFLHYKHSIFTQFLMTSFFNVLIIGSILLIIWLYAKFKLQQPLQNIFGLGDLLFFLAIAVGFPTIPFIVLFSFSLFFSLILFLMIKRKFQWNVVPLAGLQALFFSLIFLLNWIFNRINLYQF